MSAAATCTMWYFRADTRIGPDGDTLNIYYGAGDSCIALAQASMRSLLNWLDHNGRTNDADRNF